MEKYFRCCFLIFIFSSVLLSVRGKRDCCQCVSEECQRSETSLSKLVVGLGNTRDGLTNDIEVIDLKHNWKCHDLPPFPNTIHGAIGMFDFDGTQPLICGGHGSAWHDSCFKLDESGLIWTKSSPLNGAKEFAAISPSPFPDESIKYFITGGRNDEVTFKTTEVLTEAGDWEIVTPLLPVKIYKHCTVLVNASTVMVIGGYQNEQISAKTFILDTAGSEEWIEGPSLKFARSSHQCGKIRMNDSDVVIVVGGFQENSVLSSTEIFDAENNVWIEGPNLPFGIGFASLVEDQSGGIILVGGYSDEVSHLNTLLRLSSLEDETEWVELPQRLKTGRNEATAFLVNDKTVSCDPKNT